MGLYPRIRFRDYKFETEDAWEIEQVKEWMREHPEDGIKEVKNYSG